MRRGLSHTRVASVLNGAIPLRAATRVPCSPVSRPGEADGRAKANPNVDEIELELKKAHSGQVAIKAKSLARCGG
jgi:hypothetical protein